MYLLVAVTLIVAIIGVYSQALSVQTARFFSTQTTVANTMQAWHKTAVAHARYANLDLSTTDQNGCSLTSSSYNNAINPCVDTPAGNSAVIDGTNPSNLPLCSGTQTNNCWTNFPTGYKTNPYTFYSIVYRAPTGSFYIITFVPPPTINAANPAPGNIVLPPANVPGAVATQIGVTMPEFTNQIKALKLSSFSYGTAQTGVGGFDQLSTPPLSNGANASSVTYPMPQPAVVPLNSPTLITPL